MLPTKFSKKSRRQSTTKSRSSSPAKASRNRLCRLPLIPTSSLNWPLSWANSNSRTASLSRFPRQNLTPRQRSTSGNSSEIWRWLLVTWHLLRSALRRQVIWPVSSSCCRATATAKVFSALEKKRSHGDASTSLSCAFSCSTGLMTACPYWCQLGELPKLRFWPGHTPHLGCPTWLRCGGKTWRKSRSALQSRWPIRPSTLTCSQICPLPWK
mmetsp:Transcript_6362/g.9249  ORF Transcript_6362/g.9249 Transcript_6362/m.9249 type:complete len:212 (+) Transcript_6362:874-1509(+)